MAGGQLGKRATNRILAKRMVAAGVEGYGEGMMIAKSAAVRIEARAQVRSSVVVLSSGSNAKHNWKSFFTRNVINCSRTLIILPRQNYNSAQALDCKSRQKSTAQRKKKQVSTTLANLQALFFSSLPFNFIAVSTLDYIVMFSGQGLSKKGKYSKKSNNSQWDILEMPALWSLAGKCHGHGADKPTGQIKKNTSLA